MADEQYHTVIMPFTDSENLTALESELTERWGPLIMKEGHAFAAAAGTHTTIATLAESRNCPHLTIMGSGKSPTPPWVVAAVLGGVDAFEPDPARPRQTLTLPGVLSPAIPDRFTMAERNIHLHGGASTCVTDSGGNVLIERLITTYTVNAFDIEDTSYLDVTTMRTLSYLRYSVRARIAQKFPRHKLADDGTKFGAGQAVVTPQTIRAELIALFIQWEESGLVEGREQFKSDLIVERDGSDPNRLNALLPPDIINQFRIFAGSIQFKV
jgi:phage tail sheath gpL-like